MELLSIYLLLTHCSPGFALYNTAHHCPIIPDQNLFPREACKHARREILANLEPSKPTLLHNSGRTYLASILSAQGIDFHQAYYGTFFTLSTWITGSLVLTRGHQSNLTQRPSLLCTYLISS